MSKWKEIKRLIKRRRHGKGFGIHSPFAFMLITQIFHSPYRYYGYDDIESLLESTQDAAVIRHDSRLIIRIIARMGIREVVGVGDIHKAIRHSIRIADSRVVYRSQPGNTSPRLIYLTTPTPDIDMLHRCANEDGNFIIFRGIASNETLRTQFLTTAEKCSHGVIFEDTDITAIAVNTKVPVITYQAKL